MKPYLPMLILIVLVTSNSLGRPVQNPLSSTDELYDQGFIYDGYGSEGNDEGRKIVLDGSGNKILAGITSSSGLFTHGYDLLLNGSNDAFLMKIHENGTVAWGTYLGGSSSENGEFHNYVGVNIDLEENIIITGSTSSTNFPLKDASFSTQSGSRDIFISKFTSSGDLVWSTYFGGSGSDEAHDLVIDDQNDIYIVGDTQSSNLPGSDVQNQAKGQRDIVVSKFTEDGNFLWSRYLGGSSNDFGFEIDIDSNGNLFVSGESYSTNYSTESSYQTILAGEDDVILTRLQNNGEIVWSTYFGGSSYDVGRGLTIDEEDNLYLCGYTWSTDFPIIEAFQSEHQRETRFGFEIEDTDIFISKFNQSGFPIWSTFLGGNSTDLCFGMVSDSENSVYITGTTSSDISSLERASGYRRNTVLNDVIISKLTDAGKHEFTLTLGESLNEEGTSIDISGSNLVISAISDSEFQFRKEPTDLSGSSAIVISLDLISLGLAVNSSTLDSSTSSTLISSSAASTTLDMSTSTVSEAKFLLSSLIAPLSLVLLMKKR